MTTNETRTCTITVAGAAPAEVTITERGDGHPFLVLHGGGGPQTVTGFADLLAAGGDARVITPVHPGFGGTPRPNGLDSPRGLAALYGGLLDELGLTGVTVVGNSIGGWSPRRWRCSARPAPAVSSWSTPSASRSPGTRSPTSSR
jgi:pimeloyl-ACP methyl ester carboxylesterase